MPRSHGGHKGHKCGAGETWGGTEAAHQPALAHTVVSARRGGQQRGMLWPRGSGGGKGSWWERQLAWALQAAHSNTMGAGLRGLLLAAACCACCCLLCLLLLAAGAGLRGLLPSSTTLEADAMWVAAGSDCWRMLCAER